MYNKTVLDNGVRILSERAEHLKSLSLGIWVDAGSRDEVPETNGISHFIEHMIFKGTKTRTSLEIAKELDAIGGLSNAFTGKESTCFHARVLGKHFPLLADILSDIFLNSMFDPDDMEKERLVILQEISMVEDTPDENIHVLFNKVFWRGHPIGMPILGTVDTVRSIKRETIFEYMATHYTPEKILIVAAGDVHHDDMVARFAPLFERLEKNVDPPARYAPQPNSDIKIQTKDLEQVHLCLGGQAPSLRSKSRFACGIFNTILGGNMSSRLFQEIREKRGLAYSVYSFLSAYMDTGVLGIYVATDPQRVNATLESISKEVKSIINGQIREEDVAAAKEHLTGGIYLSSDNTDNRMMRIAKNELIFGRYVSYDELVENLEKVTVQEVIDVTRDIFQDHRVSFVALGPLKEKDLDLHYLDFN